MGQRQGCRGVLQGCARDDRRAGRGDGGRIKQNPKDLESRKKLVTFYQTNGRKVLGDEKTITAFRAHKLWFIEHHPEDEFASFANPLSDPLGYEQERKLWIAVVARKDLPAQALLRAGQLPANQRQPTG